LVKNQPVESLKDHACSTQVKDYPVGSSAISYTIKGHPIHI